MIKLIATLLTGALLLTSIYDYELTSCAGNTVNLNNYQGKTILFVNIATGSSRAAQLSEMQQLNETIGDSLVIIAVPSNDFGNETRTGTDIRDYCFSTYGVTYPIMERSHVTGSSKIGIYEWLTEETKNGVINNDVRSDFQKYLIDREGNLMAVFSGETSPLSPEIIQVITGQ